MNSYPSDYPPQLTEDEKLQLRLEIENWCLKHTLTLIAPNKGAEEEKTYTNAPVTLFPSPFPKSCFEQAMDLQKAYNELYAAISDDADWLQGVLSELCEVDPFINNLWQVHSIVAKDGYTQDLSLGMFRSDYMLHSHSSAGTLSLKQVEFNTISASFGGLSSKTTDLHTHLINTSPQDATGTNRMHPFLDPNVTSLPENGAILNLVSGLYLAHKAYGYSRSQPPLPLCILFIVQPGERNVSDQDALSSKLEDDYRIRVFRLEVSDILKQTRLLDRKENPDRPLHYLGGDSSQNIHHEVSTIYFRALYSPSEYDGPTRFPNEASDSTWFARLRLEQSCAIKCPTVLTQLAGCKKVQQVLADPGQSETVLRRFLPNATPSTISSLASTFAPQYALDEVGFKLATDDTTASNHVLKPQREGGGNNIYRSEIPPFVSSMSSEERARWVLMELIQTPPTAINHILRSDSEIFSGEVISELGIFGTALWRRKRWHEKGRDPSDKSPLVMSRNEDGGYLLRTKARSSDEGGVAAGFGSLDTPRLYMEGWKEEAEAYQVEYSRLKYEGKGEGEGGEERAVKRTKLEGN